MTYHFDDYYEEVNLCIGQLKIHIPITYVSEHSRMVPIHFIYQYPQAEVILKKTIRAVADLNLIWRLPDIQGTICHLSQEDSLRTKILGVLSL
jgi:hypothetical protein